MNFLNYIDYNNVDNCIENFENIQYPNDNKNLLYYHVYWYGKLTRKQILCIHSYLSTQELTNSKLFVFYE